MLTRQKIPVVIFTLMIFVALSSAHPPSDISAEYDTLEQKIKIFVKHNVRDVNKHFVAKLELHSKNNKKVEQSCVKQINNEYQEYLYKVIDLKIGDTLNIKADCNINGNKRATFVLEPGTLKSPQ
ncbi:MAG: hypothetical protein ACPL28_09895 [bacterium]